MSIDHIRYDLLAQSALRGVVRTVLTDAAKNGLPGEHHFYIAFDTRSPGVRISARLLEQYPQEMTIVLQHQFWDLKVDREGFEVGLSFGGIPERLAVPFAAIKGFFDPSVQFGLQFESEPADEAAGPREAAGPPVAMPQIGNEALLRPPARFPDSAAPAPAADIAANAPPTPEEGGEVVRLDRFRKKDDKGRSTEDGTKRR